MTTGGLLSEYCAGLPEQRRETIEVPPKGSQKARQATVAIRFDAIELMRPERTGNGNQPRVGRALGRRCQRGRPAQGR
jgi:hypothetical protein